MTLSSLLLFTILLLQVVSFVEGAAQQKNCPHGLTSMDIAANSTQDLTGKIALVTGGRSGLGYAISQALVSRGCQVIIASRNATLNEQAVEQLNTNATGTPVSYRTFDLESFASVRAFASNFTQQHDRLDFYFGNAGQGDFGPQPITNDGYERIFQVNYVSQVLLIELLLPLLRQTPQSRILLTGSNSHTQACGALGMDGDCWSDDSKALATLPYDQAGLEALNYTFDCPPLSGTYPITKYLMTILARAISKHEQPSLLNNNSSVSAYAWAPGNINTDLNQWAMCCFAPPPETEVDINDQCRFQLPYVGPRNAVTGNPDPPPMPQINHWVSPAHGTMAPIYAAMVAPVQEAGSFYATYWECEPNQGFTPLGITDTMIDEIYRQSKVWAGIVIAGQEEEEEEEEIDGDVEEEERNTTNVATTNDPSTISSGGASSVASSVATSTASSWFHRGLLHSSAMVVGLLVLSY